VVRGARTWEEIQQAQGTAHVCLSTSLRDATQIAVLEPLARGIPVVSTRVGDAPGYYARGLRSFCVAPENPEAAAEAILALASSYDRYRARFAANAPELVRRHRDGARRLAALLESSTSTARDGAPGERGRAELPVT
jgi:glycosyltransferase involved in cell wall biosynthesis